MKKGADDFCAFFISQYEDMRIRPTIIPPVVLAVILAGCQSTAMVPNTESEIKGQAQAENEVRYSVIYMIHADSDYLYHDQEGKARQADEKVLDEAQNLGMHAKGGEVFIFHQFPERKILGLFPLKNHKMHYYRNGRLIHSQGYRYLSSDSLFQKEALLYHRFSVSAQQTVPVHSDKHEDGVTGRKSRDFRQTGRIAISLDSGNDSSGSTTDPPDDSRIFLYFGHEIPEARGRGYYKSNRDIDVTSRNFAYGVERFLPEEKKKMDLVVLSSCNNGTPQMAGRLDPFTNILLASPQNLHLSHIDTDSLSILETEPGTEGLKIANALASGTFERLSTFIQTEITLSVYDLKSVSSHIKESVRNVEESPPGEYTGGNVDCADYPEFYQMDYSSGVNTLYQPARFGRDAVKSSHSGWGCR